VGRTFERYLRDIGSLHLLSREQEAELAARSREGDPDARARLVSANLRFVVSVARRYRNRGLTMADLVSEGNLGLLRAAERFDGSKGVRFISYAIWWIRQAMLQAIASENGPAGRHRQVSLEAPARPDRPVRVQDVIGDHTSEGPEGRVDRRALRDAIDSSLTWLPAREERVLRLAYGLDGEDPLTLEEVGTRLGVSRHRARQLKDRALARLRSGARRQILASFRGGKPSIDSRRRLG
jgi:RNA polymerase primary sigma factor